MFICYLHGWTGAENPCPLCHSVHMFTSSGTDLLRKPSDVTQDDYTNLRNERDQLRAEVERLNTYTIVGYETMIEELKVAAEKLAEALESVKRTVELKSNDVLWCHDEVNMTAVEKIELSLAEYREKFSKE